MLAKSEDKESINKKFEKFKKSITEFAEKIQEHMPMFIDVGGKILSAPFESMKTVFEPIILQVIGWKH